MGRTEVGEGGEPLTESGGYERRAGAPPPSSRSQARCRAPESGGSGVSAVVDTGGFVCQGSSREGPPPVLLRVGAFGRLKYIHTYIYIYTYPARPTGKI